MKYASKPLLYAVLVFLIVVALTQYLAYQNYELEKDREHKELVRELSNVKDRFRGILYNDIMAANTMVVISKQYDINTHFDSFAKQILAFSQYVEAIQLSEHGIIKQIYPIQGHENAIGLNIGEDPLRRKEADKALEKKGIYFAGPRKLREGGIGILCKVAIAENSDAKRFITVLTKLPTIVQALAPDEKGRDKYAYTLIKTSANNDTESYLLSTAKPAGKSEVVSTTIPEGDWQLCAAYGAHFVGVVFPNEVSILGFFISLLAALFAYRLAKEPLRLNRIIASKTHLLGERIKELSTIYLVSNILQDDSQSAEEVFMRIVNILPPGWQYPDVCEAKIIFDGKEYTTKGYRPSAINQTTDFILADQRYGSIEVIYTENRPVEGEGPFLKEERDLINSLAKTIVIYFDKAAQQRALMESEIRFRGAFEFSAIGMSLVTLDGKWIKVNKELCSMVGYTEAEMLSFTFQDLTYPDDLDNDLSLLHKALNGEIDFYRIEKRYIHKSRAIVWVNLNVALIRDNNRQPLYFVGQIENITERVESQMKFRNLVEKSTVGVYILKDGKFVYVNPRIAQESGYTEQELTNMPVEHFIYKDDLPIVYDNVNARLRGEINEVRYEIRTIKKDGGIMWLEMFGAITIYQGDNAIIGTMVDITDQKRSLALIKKREAELTALFENVDGSASLLDVNKRYLLFNAQYIKTHTLLTGHEPLLGHKMYEFFSDKVRNERSKALDDVLQNNKISIDGEYVRNGRRIYLRTSYHPVVADGKVNGISTYSIDLTEIREAEIALKEAEYKFRSLVEKSMVGVYIIQNGKFVYVNPKMCGDLGYDEAELMEMCIEDLLYKSDEVLVNERPNYSRENRPNIAQYEAAALAKNGQILWFDILGSTITYSGGPAVMGTMVNVTEKKTVNDELIRSEANIRSIYNNTNVNYLLISSDFTVVSFNEHFVREYFRNTNVHIKAGDDFIDSIAPERREEAKKRFMKVIDTLQSVEYEVVYTNNGNTEYIYNTITPIVKEGIAVGLCMSGIDITQRKMLELERERMIADLVQRNNDLEQFAQIVSHNIRGPLATILGLDNLMLDTESAEEKEVLQEGIRSCAHRLDGVLLDLNDILQVRREITESKTGIDMEHLVLDISLSIALMIKESGAIIKTDFAAVREIQSVRSYVNNIFYKLITNSIKYARQVEKPYIEIWSEQQNDKLLIYFRDNGLGIDLEKYRDKIFKMYQRFDFSVEGKGFGLFMVRTQIEALGGSIDINSIPGTGTTFTVCLPL